MDLAVLFGSAFLVGFSGAAAPGPMLTLTISRTIRQGAIAGPLVVFGHALLEIATVIGIVYGLGYYLQLPAVTRGIAVVGGLVLAWMGLQMIRDFRNVGFSPEEIAASGKPSGSAASVLAGVAGSISNPYWFLWWATIGAAFLAQAMVKGAAGVGIFFTGHILADFVWYSLVSVSLSAGRKLFTNQQYQKLFLCCGLFMVCLSLYFIWSGTVGNISLGG